MNIDDLRKIAANRGNTIAEVPPSDGYRAKAMRYIGEWAINFDTLFIEEDSLQVVSIWGSDAILPNDLEQLYNIHNNVNWFQETFILGDVTVQVRRLRRDADWRADAWWSDDADSDVLWEMSPNFAGAIGMAVISMTKQQKGIK